LFGWEFCVVPQSAAGLSPQCATLYRTLRYTNINNPTPHPNPTPKVCFKKIRETFPPRLETEMAHDKTRFQCGAKLAKKVDKENGFASDNEILFRG